MAETNLYHDVRTFNLNDLQLEVNHINNLYRRDYQQWLRIYDLNPQDASQRYVWEEATMRYGYFISSHSALGQALYAWANNPINMEDYAYLLGAFASEDNYFGDYNYARTVLTNQPENSEVDGGKTLDELTSQLPDDVQLPQRSVNLQLHTDSDGNIYIGANKPIQPRQLVKRLLGSTVPDIDPAEALVNHQQGNYPGGWDFIQPANDIADMITPVMDDELAQLYKKILTMSYPGSALPGGQPHIVDSDSKLYHVLSYWFAKNGKPATPEEIIAILKENNGVNLPVETDGKNLIILGDNEDGSLSAQQFDKLLGGNGDCEITHLFMQRYGDLLNYTGRGNQHVSVDSLLNFVEAQPAISVDGTTVYPKKLSVNNPLYQKILQHYTQQTGRPVGRADLLTILLQKGFRPHEDNDGGIIFDNLQPESANLTSLTLLDQLCGGNGEGITAQEIVNSGEQDHSLWMQLDTEPTVEQTVSPTVDEPTPDENQPTTEEPEEQQEANEEPVVYDQPDEDEPVEDETRPTVSEPKADEHPSESPVYTPDIVSNPENEASNWLDDLLNRAQQDKNMQGDMKTAMQHKPVSERQKQALYAAFQSNMITREQAIAIRNSYEAHVVLNNIADKYGEQFIPKFSINEEEKEQQKKKGMSR